MKHGDAALCAGLAMCRSFQAAGQAPGELQASSRLTEDPGKHDSWTYRNPDANLATYKRFIIEPTAIYADPAATWGSTTQEQRQKFADKLTKALRDEIGSSYQIADKPRSEEHTSELQSLMRISYAVFCLKNKKTRE